MNVKLSNRLCRNCDTQVVTRDSFEISTPKFVYPTLLVQVSCASRYGNFSLTVRVAIMARQ